MEIQKFSSYECAVIYLTINEKTVNFFYFGLFIVNYLFWITISNWRFVYEGEKVVAAQYGPSMIYSLSVGI